MTLRSAGPLLVAALLVAACGSSLPAPEFFDEQPVGSQTWKPITAEPGWVTAPPKRDGYLRFVSDAKSNLRGIVASGKLPFGEHDAEKLVREKLIPVIGDADAAAAATASKSKLNMVQRACREELLTHDVVVGNTLCTAWALWEVSIDDVVAAVPAEKRDAARTALAGK